MMLSSVAATKLESWLEDLTAVPVPDKARLTAILDDITASIKNMPFEHKAACYDAKGIAFALLNDEKEALAAHHNAHRLDKNEYHYVLNWAVSCRRFGRAAESLDLHAKALEMDEGYNSSVLGSLAHTLADVGEIEEARKALQEAFRLSSGDDPEELRNLAAYSANLGLNSEAVELLARSLCCFRNIPRGTTPALDVLHENKATLSGWFVWDYRLAIAIGQVASWQGKFPELSALTSDLPRLAERNDPAWDEAFAGTRGFRERANAAEGENYRG